MVYWNCAILLYFEIVTTVKSMRICYVYKVECLLFDVLTHPCLQAVYISTSFQVIYRCLMVVVFREVLVSCNTKWKGINKSTESLYNISIIDSGSGGILAIYQFLWIVQSLLPLRFSLMFTYCDRINHVTDIVGIKCSSTLNKSKFYQ